MVPPASLAAPGATPASSPLVLYRDSSESCSRRKQMCHESWRWDTVIYGTPAFLGPGALYFTRQKRFGDPWRRWNTVIYGTPAFWTQRASPGGPGGAQRNCATNLGGLWGSFWSPRGGGGAPVVTQRRAWGGPRWSLGASWESLGGAKGVVGRDFGGLWRLWADLGVTKCTPGRAGSDCGGGAKQEYKENTAVYDS